MVNWVAWEAIATSVLVVTSAGAISYAGLQLANERKYRSVSNLEKQLSFFLSAPFALARTQLAHDRVNAAGLVALDIHEPPVSAFEVLDFYEHLGLLVKKGHLDVYDVWHTFYEWAQPVYLDLRPLIENNESPYSEQYSDLRKLMRQMDDIQLDKMHEQRANHWALWTPERIMEHYRYELETGGLRRRMIRRQRKQEAREDAAAVSAGAGGVDGGGQ
ncbi:MAG: hypothetical protein M3R43_04635 [Acidobacteriota bacterium]|nr:hypothetical protein [Acidobacteriota bacterium]